MAKPKHKRCAVCGVVVSRYSHTTTHGPFSVKVWVRDEHNGSVQGADGKPYCDEHAEVGRSFKAPHVPAESVTTAALRLAANDQSLDDATYTVLARALRGVDPLGGEVPA